MTQQRAGRPGYPQSFEQVAVFPGRMVRAAARSDLRGLRRLNKPWLNGLPRGIFISDMGDSLSQAVTFEYLLVEVLLVVDSDQGGRHRWLWLTKRPRRMALLARWLEVRGFDWPTNLWAGTSVTGRAYEHRVNDLLEVGNAQTKHFISVEPQRDKIEFNDDTLAQVDWVIQGGQSRQGRQPRDAVPAFELDWARQLRDRCELLGVPYFLKQLGSRPTENGACIHLADRHGGECSEWPADLRLRHVPR